ncbi:LPXTG cell wall anchor domain-containing protein [Amycolatopsis sp. PS_44_ISF1]|uniref:LPXTG cell wall anchor domain-containing protein n=1 Tax=Amycolatopsis sp. PS_44_ISF1 TaxID=2974917 RepID=UPI0028DE21C6|nr:LPXTG cell wall anchor domain-containing protein [Amycolatopsis sp. PS_44_ISF1]MDT8911545.1 LPXTG cell wall anchor domain-containing protein [Amycolatopsis sp. PS_44_ISF1]
MRTTTRRPIRAGLTIAAVAGLALLGSATSALACTSGDGRANPTPGTDVTRCSDLRGISGKTLDQGEFTFTGGAKSKSVSITAVKEGVTVEAIVVVGGDDGHAVYVPGKKGLGHDVPWNDLIAPFSFDHSQPKVDHWFACGTKTVTEPTKTTEPAKPSQTPTSAPSSSPAETTAPASSSSVAAVVPAGNESGTGGGLANTGFDNMWLVWTGGLLLVVGGGLLVLLKLRRRGTN